MEQNEEEQETKEGGGEGEEEQCVRGIMKTRSNTPRKFEIQATTTTITTTTTTTSSSHFVNPECDADVGVFGHEQVAHLPSTALQKRNDDRGRRRLITVSDGVGVGVRFGHGKSVLGILLQNVQSARRKTCGGSIDNRNLLIDWLIHVLIDNFME